MNTLTLGSLFDGSGTAPLAATMCGVTPVWASEIEPYPIRVTTARFPDMKHLGNITDINGAEVTPVDIICGGSPCQDLSVAGKQAGLHNGERSHLFFEMTRIIKEMRGATNGRYPRYIVWENVPGAFSSNKGRDFLAVLQAFAEIADPDVYVPEPESKADRLVWKYAGEIMGDGWSIAWRTVDAQYWGVPQRRRRIYLVAGLTGECAGEILFERTGLSGNSAQGREAREEAAADAGRSFEGSSEPERLTSSCEVYSTGACGFPLGYRPENTALHPEKSATICNGTRPGFTTGVVFDITGVNSNSIKSPTPDSCFKQRNIGRTLDTFVGSPECNQGGMVAVEIVGALCARDYKGVSSQYVSEGKCVVQEAVCIGNGQLNQISMAEQSNCLDCMHDKQAILTNGKPPRKYIVRRLTPLECCRLQGFPDWWEDGVEGSDSARYKMWGNGMALPNMLHVMKGIVRVQEDESLWVR